MPIKENVILLRKENLKPDIFKFSVKAPEIVRTAKQGQFLEIRITETTAPFLRRPISIHNIDRTKEIIEFIFQVKGEGTNLLSKKQVGESIDIVGPLGNGTFNYTKYNKLGIIGGGIGIFPLYELAKNAKNDKKEVNMYLGFRSKNLVILESEFSKVSDKIILTTDDGTYRKKGYAINFLAEDVEKNKVDSIYACGPLPMLRAVRKLAIEKNIPCQVSLEERMGCGLGACLGCAVKVADSPKENPTYWHVCKGGPVFEAKKVEF